MMELTSEQRQQIKDSGWPPCFHDPVTGECFLLIHRELFERVKGTLEKEDEISEIEAMYPLVSEVVSKADTLPPIPQ
jgi:hypothetical protein